MKKLTDRLKTLRGARSQSEFAKSLGISQVVYGRYELGTREPSIDLLIHFGKTLDVSVDWLLGLTDNQNGLGGKGVAPVKVGLKNNIRQIHNLAEKMTTKTSELLALTEELEGTL